MPAYMARPSALMAMTSSLPLPTKAADMVIESNSHCTLGGTGSGLRRRARVAMGLAARARSSR
jgi:hypothetical protein